MTQNANVRSVIKLKHRSLSAKDPGGVLGGLCCWNTSMENVERYWIKIIRKSERKDKNRAINPQSTNK